MGGFFHNDHSDQAHLSQNGDILLKCTLQTYSCFPASFQAKGKCQQVTRKVLRIKHTACSTPQQQKHPFVLWSGCQFVQPWPVGRWCQDPKKSKSVVPSDGPNPSQSEGGHLEGTQAGGKWIRQDSQGLTESPTTSGGCNLPGGRVIWCTRTSKSPQSLSPFQKLCPPSHQSSCPPRKRTVPSPLPLVENLWGSQTV